MKKVSCFVALSLLVGCEGFGLSAPCVGRRLFPQSGGIVDLAFSSRGGGGGGVSLSMASRRDALSSAAPASLAALAAAVATAGPGPALAAENPAEWAIHEGAFSPDTEFADYVTTESGLKYKDVVVGSGETPVKTDTVRAHYVGYTLNGKIFDKSYGMALFPFSLFLDSSPPTAFRLSKGLIPGFTEALLGMKVGGKRICVLKPSLAYGKAGVGDIIPPDSTLVFYIELRSIGEGISF